MLYTVISLFIHHGVWGRRAREENKYAELEKSSLEKALDASMFQHTGDSSNEGKKRFRHEKRFFRRARLSEKPKSERVEVENEKEVQARHFRLCFAWEASGGGGGEEEALETNSQINMIQAISIQHTNGGVIWLCEKDSKEPAGGWLRKKKHRKKGTEIVK